MLDTKKFANQLIIDAQIQGYKPVDIDFDAMFGLFDFEKFEKNLKFIKTDEIGLVLYKLALCDAIFMPSYVNYGSKRQKSFSQFVIEYCGGSDLLLREEFGEHPKWDCLATPKIENVEGNYYLLDGVLFCHQPKMFLLDWILPYFRGFGCMPFCGSFITSEDSLAMQFVDTCVSERIIQGEKYDEFLNEYLDDIEAALNGGIIDFDDDE